MSTGIYQITNTVNGKSYIGQSRNIYKRWKQHTGGLKSPYALDYGNYPLRYDLIKYDLKETISKPGRYGAFEFKILEPCNSDDLLKRERYWIEKINPEYNCHVWTPKSKKVSRNSATRHWIQYHNFDKLGYVPGGAYTDDDFDYEYCDVEDAVSCISTNKRSILNAKGDIVFLIVGIGKNPKQYYLWSRLILEDIEIVNSKECKYYHAFGNGWLLNSPQRLQSDDFKQFRSSCGNFAFGFMSIDNSPYCHELIRLSDKHKATSTKINFVKYSEDFYKKVICINPNESRRLYQSDDVSYSY